MPKLFRSALLEVPPSAAYAVVIDVARYPEFLPGCHAVSVLQTTSDGLVAQVSITGAGIKESFVTNNVHTANALVVMSLRDGPFERLEGRWTFTALGDIGCRIDLHIDYEPKGILSRILGTLANRAANKIVDAFSERIGEQYRN